MSGVVIFVPSVCLSDATSLADRQREFPRLAWCLGAAARTPHDGPLEPLLASAGGMPADCALAALTALHDLNDPSADLLRSDPVHLHADPNKVLVYGPAQLALSATEADDLLGSLQQEFPELGWQRGVEPSRWYVRRPAEVAGCAPSAQWLNGRSLTPFMPLAANQRIWRRWLNDLQMVLHEHPVNQHRARAGRPTVNGVWWFGAGSPAVAGASSFTQMIGNDVLLAGLARQTGCAWQSRTAPEQVLAEPGETLLVAGEAFGAATAESVISLVELETAWLPKLLNALRRRRLTALTIMTSTHRARLTWFPSWQTWRAAHAFKVE
jgi:hypothetical protein